MIGTPYDFGGAAAASFAVSHATTAGDLLAVAVGTNDSAASPTGVTDDKPHTYRLVDSSRMAGAQCAYLYVLEDASALTVANTVTSAWPASGTQSKNVRGVACAGLDTTSPEDSPAIGKATGQGTTASARSGQMAKANSLVVAVCVSGIKTLSHAWAAGWTQIGSTLHATTTNASFVSVAIRPVSAVDPVTASVKLGATGNWAMLVVPFSAAPAGAGVTITSTALEDAIVGQAYLAQLEAATSNPPVTWDTVPGFGTLPPGLTLTPGSGGNGGGGGKPITYAGCSPSGPADTGYASGADPPSAADWTYAQSVIGPGMRTQKIFPYAWGGTTNLPSTWNNSGPVKAMCDNDEGSCPILVWDTVMSSAAIRAFLDTVPAGQALAFCWRNEPEGTGTAADYIAGFQNQANIIHGYGNPDFLMVTNSYIYQYRSGGLASALSGAWIPDRQYVDAYCCDVYQRQGSTSGAWSSQGLANHVGFQNWFRLVKPQNRPIGFTEYGINICGTENARNARLQQDWDWVRKFGTDAGASPYPLFCWMYWWRNMAGSPQCFTTLRFPPTSPTGATWRALVASAGIAGGSSSGGGGGGGGGQITGTPTTAGDYSVRYRATDAAGSTGTKDLSIHVSSTAVGLAIDTTSPLPDGTVGAGYDLIFTAHGRQTPYTWALDAGAWPGGLTLTDGHLSGTPTTAGSFSGRVRCTSADLATATLDWTMTVAAGLQVTTTYLPPARVGTAYAALLTSVGGVQPVSWGLADDSTDVLPAGLAIDSDGQSITGTPTAPGVFRLKLEATDAAGITATALVTLTVATEVGGLLPIGRRIFGGTSADWAGRFVGDVWDRAPYAVITFWNDQITGSQYTDLTTLAGLPVTYITADSFGEFGQFYGPEGVLSMWADANDGSGPRRLITCADMPDLVRNIWTALAELAGGG